ncbi:acyl carrier protein [Peterkaempfera griseoplana]|uniref:acyl carrier protein n=1 Tax=Peterkaempfera griseoplana TaxID=66896 RepID=UPI0006E39F04|nr:acyl carrier protein [Peterkaempfera griseoplana]
MTGNTIRTRLAELVEESSDGVIPAELARTGGTSLSALGLTSLSRMRLVDAVEAEYDVEIDLDAEGWGLLDDLDALAAHLAAR